MDIYAALENHFAKTERVKNLVAVANDLAWDRITSGEDDSQELLRIGFLMETALESFALREKEFASILKAMLERKSPLAQTLAGAQESQNRAENGGHDDYSTTAPTWKGRVYHD